MREQVPPSEVEPQPRIPWEPLMVMEEFERAAVATDPAGSNTPPPDISSPPEPLMEVPEIPWKVLVPAPAVMKPPKVASPRMFK